MTCSIPTRIARTAVLTACCLLASSGMGAQQHGTPGRSPFGQHQAPQPPRMGGGRLGPNQQHLSQWLEQHRNMPLQQQQRALENEPGFRELPPQTQQRMREHLNQLNSMQPEQRERLLQRTENMERLSPAERQNFRNSVQQLGSYPVDRRRMVARAFRDIREMPIPQRQAVLNSDRFRSQFSPEERQTLSNLLTVEPYIPSAAPSGPPPQ